MAKKKASTANNDDPLRMVSAKIAKLIEEGAEEIDSYRRRNEALRKAAESLGAAKITAQQKVSDLKEYKSLIALIKER